MGDVQTVRGGGDAAAPGPVFVDVVTGDGVAQSVPAEWVGNPIFDKGWTVVEDTSEAAAAPAVAGEPSEVQLTGPESDVSLIPAVRDAVQAHDAVVEEAAEADPPTERSTHEEIDAYALTHDIDLGDAGTKAEKLAVIEEHTTDTDDTESSDETPGNGDEEN